MEYRHAVQTALDDISAAPTAADGKIGAGCRS